MSEPATEAEPGRVRLVANLSTEVIDALRWIAVQRGVSMTEALRQAITTEHFLAKEVASQQRIILRDPKSRRERELIFNRKPGWISNG